jgi:hypothetical protein
MKIKVFVSLVLTFMLMFNMSVSSFAVHQVDAVNDGCPFERMGLNVFPGDDIPAIIPHSYSEPEFIREESGGRIYCSSDSFVIRGASINLLPGQTLNISEEDLNILVDFVVDTLLIRNVGVGFYGSFENALREAGLYEIFFSRIGERLNSQINPVPQDSYITPAPLSGSFSGSLQNGQEWTGGLIGSDRLRVSYDFAFNPFATVEVGFRSQTAIGNLLPMTVMATHSGTSASGSFIMPPAVVGRFNIRHSTNSNAFGISLSGHWSAIFSWL